MQPETHLPENPDSKSDEALPEHRIRSFIRRQGRITVAQTKALSHLWPVYGLESGQVLDVPAVFGRIAPLVLEIGFGNGEALATMALENPDFNHIGVEVHRPGVGHLLLRLSELSLTNIRIYCADAVEILTRNIADASLDRIQLFFPDPWPKKRHHKRRIVNADFLALVNRKLKPGGVFHAATDWEPYATAMAESLEACPELVSTAPGPFAPRPGYRPRTKFESRGQRLGHGVWDLLYRRETETETQEPNPAPSSTFPALPESPPVQ
jgi:tRNA (guanine-N7-)-methyltransferase